MKTLNPVRFAFGLAVAGVVLYIACAIFISVADRDTVVIFTNSLLHCLNIDPIFRQIISFAEVLQGLVGTFVITWVFGAIAGFV